MIGLLSSRLAWLFPHSRTAGTGDVSAAEQELNAARATLTAIDRGASVIEFQPDGTIVRANDNFLRTVGYTLEEIRGRHHQMFVDPAYAASPEYAEFWSMLQAGQQHRGTFCRVAKDGSLLHLDASYTPIFDDQGKPCRIVKFVTDITAQVLHQQESNRLINMMDNLPINVMYCDRDYIIRYINPASRTTLQKIERLLPVPVDKVVGSSVDVFHANPAHQRKLLSDPRNLPAQAQFNLGPETISLLCSPIFDRQGEYVGAMATWQVITEQALIRRQVGNLAEVGNTVATNVNEMITAMDEISLSIGRTAELASDTDNQARTASESTTQLTACSAEIEGIVTVIRELAEQTNLLALNATIEAARAGEAGRSFAVVASEVKSLATETRDATETIAERVQRIRTNIDSVVAATEGITSSVAEVSQNSNTVAAAVEEQTAIINGMKSTAEKLVHLSDDLKKL